MALLKQSLLIIFNILFFLAPTDSYASMSGGRISGRVLDKKSNAPVEYATVRVFRHTDSTLVTGTISNELGGFQVPDLPVGDYYVMVDFLGYKNYTRSHVQISSTAHLDLGTLLLQLDDRQLDEVVVTSDYNNIDYQIDKKIISVDQQLTSASMSAVDVLANVPSVAVDIDGNVSLRGSTGFVVLIDGKPTVLDPGDALRQIPASTILNIEIITNPSAKYVPDGTGGVINIITKKNQNRGISGLLNGRVGSFGMHGGDLLLNYKKGKSNFYVGGDYGRINGPSNNASERRTELNDTTTTIISKGNHERNFARWSVRGGWDLDIMPKDAISLGFRLGNFKMETNSNSNYTTFQDPGSVLEELTDSKNNRESMYFNVTGNFLHKFSRKQEELSLQVNYSVRDDREMSINFLFNNPGTSIIDASSITEVGPSNSWNIRMDYTRPFGENYLLEVGSQFRLGTSGDETTFRLFDSAPGELVVQPNLGNDISYSRDIYGFYGTFRGTLSALGYQVGVRSEYTNRRISSGTAGENFVIDRLDFFPSLHLSYKLPKENQFMANYSRRIDRPRSWYLEPFITWSDLFNVRQGNPNLLPEYIDAFELNYVKSWKKNRLSIETYYRVTNNKIDRTKSVYQKNVLLTQFNNVGTDYSLGIEIFYNLRILKWWEMSIMGNLYDYRVAGIIRGENFDRTSFNWKSRLSNTFTLHKIVKLQVDALYNSSTATAQGEQRDFYVINLGLRSDFFDRKLSVSMQVRDLFASATRVSLVQTTGLYDYRSHLRNAPDISFNVSYRFNNYRSKKKKENDREMNDDF